ncbi:hypothetical protein HMPREF1986_01347 [Oribacterium sp. oral taxon 078 str. F0263]|nr:hypothetical protein GCWU000341_01112 [Oribacterium sp. oral taxon 078 str. F0262]ERL21580.1 hypothetical protein HMPREF1986_01347 [Oribacterium sp. oral taxon 078 str. F0263]
MKSRPGTHPPIKNLKAQKSKPGKTRNGTEQSGILHGFNTYLIQSVFPRYTAKRRGADSRPFRLPALPLFLSPD